MTALGRGKFELRSGRGFYGIYRRGERVATISTAIMDQAEVGTLLSAAPELFEAIKPLSSPRLGKEFSDAVFENNLHDDLPITIVVTLGEIKSARSALSKALSPNTEGDGKS